jgi:hypothetical protein
MAEDTSSRGHGGAAAQQHDGSGGWTIFDCSVNVAKLYALRRTRLTILLNKSVLLS